LIKKIVLAQLVLLIALCGSLFANWQYNPKSTLSDSLVSSEKFYHLIKEYEIGYNDVYETPYYVLLGKTENPKMILHGGMHGDEIASYMACDEIIRNINLLEGTLIIIPKINKPACEKNTRYINIDLNHAFPGNLTSDVYEFRLAHEFMWLVDSIKPDLIINLHEALTKYDSEYKDDSDRAFGQIVITCIKPFEEMLLNAIYGMNEKIPRLDYKFNVHYYSYHDYSSMDNFISKFGIRSYTVETYRGFAIDDRIKLQVIAVLQFMKEAGFKFEYPEIEF
jgi:predicted deacylase